MRQGIVRLQKQASLTRPKRLAQRHHHADPKTSQGLTAQKRSPAKTVGRAIEDS